MSDEIPYIRILGVRLHRLDYSGALSLFRKWVSEGGSHQVCIANVHTTVLGRDEPDFGNITSTSALATMDGRPLVWVAHLKGCKDASRVAGPDLLEKVCAVSEAEGYRHFFYGGAEGVASSLVGRLRDRYPGIQVAGVYSPPFRELSEQEDQSIVEMINEAKPDFLWVGLGAPKQEKWIAEHLDRLNVPVQVGVGAAFDFLSGRIKRAPIWMQGVGLEWLYRLSQDPGRLWRRYLYYNSKYVLGVIMEFVRRPDCR